MDCRTALRHAPIACRRISEALVSKRLVLRFLACASRSRIALHGRLSMVQALRRTEDGSARREWARWAACAVCLLAFDASAVLRDFDGDKIDDAVDNCPKVINGISQDNQADADGDGIGDVCECGDFDGDGRVNSTDARLIQRCTVNEIPCAELCDVTADGKCNTSDARLIQRFAVGQLTKEGLRCAQKVGCHNGQHDPTELCEDALDPFCCLDCTPRNEDQSCDDDGIACTEDRCFQGRCQLTVLNDDLCEQPELDCRPRICTSHGCEIVVRPGATCSQEAGCCDCPAPTVCIPSGPFAKVCDPNGLCVCEPGLVPVPCL